MGTGSYKTEIRGPVWRARWRRGLWNSAGIVVDKCPLAFDEKDPAITGGIRLGTPIVTRNGMGIEEMGRISGMVDEILRTVEIVSESEYRIKGSFEGHVKAQVKELCSRFSLR